MPARVTYGATSAASRCLAIDGSRPHAFRLIGPSSLLFCSKIAPSLLCCEKLSLSFCSLSWPGLGPLAASPAHVQDLLPPPGPPGGGVAWGLSPRRHDSGDSASASQPLCGCHVCRHWSRAPPLSLAARTRIPWVFIVGGHLRPHPPPTAGSSCCTSRCCSCLPARFRPVLGAGRSRPRRHFAQEL